VTSAAGKLVTERGQVGNGDALQISFADGDVSAVVTGGSPAPAKSRGKAKPPGQGDLF
jgi:exonuclease VII large subunit